MGVATVVFRNEERNVSIEGKASIEDLLLSLGINRETVIARKNGEIVPESEKVKDGDRIELLNVVSGG